MILLAKIGIGFGITAVVGYGGITVLNMIPATSQIMQQIPVVKDILTINDQTKSGLQEYCQTSETGERACITVDPSTLDCDEVRAGIASSCWSEDTKTEVLENNRNLIKQCWDSVAMGQDMLEAERNHPAPTEKMKENTAINTQLLEESKERCRDNEAHYEKVKEVLGREY